MKFKKPPRRENTENIIPLINIVFLLLIFFMITAKITAKDPFVIQPPAARESSEQESMADDILYISPTGELVYRDQTFTTVTLISHLDAHHFGSKGEALVLKADAQTPMLPLIDILAQLKQADIYTIELLTTSTQ